MIARSWADSTFVFISANADQVVGGPEERWLDVMGALRERGARVIFLSPMRSRVGEAARERGVQVDPYILDKWNVVRSRSRLRKYLMRYDPVMAESTGLEADIMLRWAAKRLPRLLIATTLTEAETQPTRRGRAVDLLMRDWEDVWLEDADAVFVDSDAAAVAAKLAGARPGALLLDPPPADPGDHMARAASIERRLGVYEGFMERRGPGGTIADGPTMGSRL